MPTVETFIKQALQELGVIEPGEDLTPDQRDVGVFRLQAMLDAWSEDGLLVPAALSVDTLVGANESKNHYAIAKTAGTGVDIVAEINKLHSVVYKRYDLTEGRPLDRINRVGLARRMHTQGSLGPSFYYFQPTVPTSTLFFNASTRQNDRFTLHYDGYLVPDTIAVDTDIVLPRGYTLPILLNLAKELGPNFGATLSRDSMATAKAGKSNIRTRNLQPTGVDLDPSLPGMRGGTNHLYPYR